MSWICPTCGQENPDSARICPRDLGMPYRPDPLDTALDLLERFHGIAMAAIDPGVALGRFASMDRCVEKLLRQQGRIK